MRETTSLYCVGHQDVADALQQQGVPSHCIRVTGIPLVPAFENIPSQQRAREKLKLGNLPTILITGGQCGIGVAPVLQQLLDDPDLQCQILVTAGSNSADQDKLRYLATRYPTRFHLFGWHSDMRDLFCAADMVVGKPGGLTVSESLACGKPFIATCCLGGQELHNVNHLQKNGAGMLVGQAELGQTIRNLLNNPQQLQAMSQQALSLGQPRAANNVVRELERLMSLKKTPESQALVVAASGSA